jgi:hypothetical protein
VTHFLTSVENIALNLIFESVNECRFNRSTAEYLNIAQRLPPVRELVTIVNRRLQEIEESGNPPFSAICRFEAGDRSIRYDPYPACVSPTTIRNALNKSGMRVRRRRTKPKL